MSEREKAKKLIDMIPDYKIGYVVAYLQGLMAVEAADEYDRKAFEEAMEEFRKNPITYTHEEVWGEFGL